MASWTKRIAINVVSSNPYGRRSVFLKVARNSECQGYDFHLGNPTAFPSGMGDTGGLWFTQVIDNREYSVPFWVQTVMNDVAWVWVRVINLGNTNIYCYYDAAGEYKGYTPDDVFDVFINALDVDKWGIEWLNGSLDIVTIDGIKFFRFSGAGYVYRAITFPYGRGDVFSVIADTYAIAPFAFFLRQRTEPDTGACGDPACALESILNNPNYGNDYYIARHPFYNTTHYFQSPRSVPFVNRRIIEQRYTATRVETYYDCILGSYYDYNYDYPNYNGFYLFSCSTSSVINVRYIILTLSFSTKTLSIGTAESGSYGDVSAVPKFGGVGNSIITGTSPTFVVQPFVINMQNRRDIVVSAASHKTIPVPSGIIRGYVKVGDKGTSKRIVLFDRQVMRPVAATFSNPVTGEYIFKNVDSTRKYLVMCDDLGGEYDVAMADYVVPEA